MRFMEPVTTNSEFWVFAVPYLWFIAGAVFLTLEALGITGIGFLFAGLAALVTGILVEYGVASPDGYGQWAWFFGLTAAWAAILWKPMQRFMKTPKEGGYSNMVGDDATVIEGGLAPGSKGKVRWSGTIMDAELAPGMAALPAGASVIIREVKGNTLIVAPNA
jgi:membrane protein implicated in regulation of membrane protease activity